MASGETSGGNNRGDGTGRLLAGRYRVLAQLGRGGMGVVWRAVDEVLGREVAVKELRTYSDADGPELADLRVRMQREARAAARVRHPGVVAVHDVAEVDGRPLIVMELVDGPSLEQVLRERGSLGPVEAAAIGAQVTDALAAAHRAGVLHRDVKPGNILLERSGRVVLTDFGIAAMDDPGDGAATRLTRSGALVGSLDYLAPERAQGADASAASDVWALGATLYAAVEGSSPFHRTSTYSTLTAIITEPLPEPVRAGPLADVLRQLLDKRPDTRPEAEQARALLRAVADAGGADTPTTTLRADETARTRAEPGGPGLPTAFVMPSPVPYTPVPDPASAPTGPLAPPGGPRRRGRVLLAAAAVTVVLAAAGGTVALVNSGGEKTPAGASASGAGVSASASASTSASTSASASASASDRTDGDRSAGAKPTEKRDGKSATPTGGEEGAATSTGRASGSATANSSGGGTTGGGTATTPAPACTSAGGGKYDCTVWRTAKSYTASGTEAGVVHAGVNYFYCQRNLGRRETYGQWTNVWWAKTDDDSGNTNVYVSDVYVKGGDNDEPVPGLPVC